VPVKISKKVVIIGGGFGGLYAAKAFRGNSIQVTLIDRRNFHLFQPLLYQVATGGLSPADIAFPLRALFKKQRNVQVILGEVKEIDFATRVVFSPNKRIHYDYLIIAAGSHHHYFGKTQWEQFAPGLKSIEDATNIRSRILTAFERAEVEEDTDKRKALLTFVVIGGGPAGVEMAGAIAELSRYTLSRDFRNINPTDARIVLIESTNRILPPYPEQLSLTAQKTLVRLGVEIMTNTMVTNISEIGITLLIQNRNSKISCGATVWAAGVQASTLATMVLQSLKVDSDKAGRLMVNSYCGLDCDENVFVIGDVAHFKDENGLPLPGVATVAMQQGRYVAREIVKRIAGKKTTPFKYSDKGSLAVIGRKSAVAFRRNVRLSGLPAWVLWLFVHLLYLVGFENRVLVAIQWAFNYFSFNQSARLITGIINRETE
jgi:NADH dehydrogenase